MADLSPRQPGLCPAGLRWILAFPPGENHLRVVARKGGAEVVDEIRFLYQVQEWGKPEALVLEETGRAGNVVTLQARLLDAAGVCCLDARNRVRFRLSGDGEMIQNLGTTSGARQLELSETAERPSASGSRGESPC